MRPQIHLHAVKVQADPSKRKGPAQAESVPNAHVSQGQARAGAPSLLYAQHLRQEPAMVRRCSPLIAAALTSSLVLGCSDPEDKVFPDCPYDNGYWHEDTGTEPDSDGDGDGDDTGDTDPTDTGGDDTGSGDTGSDDTRGLTTPASRPRSTATPPPTTSSRAAGARPSCRAIPTAPTSSPAIRRPAGRRWTQWPPPTPCRPPTRTSS